MLMASRRGILVPMLLGAWWQAMSWARLSFAQPDPVLHSTSQWVQIHVAKGPPQLCPWALRSNPLRMKHCTGREVEPLLTLLRCLAAGAEGEELLQCAESAWPTSLVVCSHEDFAGKAGLVTFSRLWRQVEESKKDSLHLLAFHPCREDRGPGCRANPLDAGHFSVRAPWPTLQLLRTSDLQRARQEWLRSHPGPGALTLLLRNKAQLRQLGRQQLHQRFQQLSRCDFGNEKVMLLPALHVLLGRAGLVGFPRF